MTYDTASILIMFASATLAYLAVDALRAWWRDRP
jgi:hypothetical protein